MTSEDLPQPWHGAAVSQEPDTVATSKVSGVLVSGVVVTAAAVIASALFLRALRAPAPGASRENAPLPEQIARIHQGPIERAGDGWARRDRASRRLREYGWVDRTAGVASIPIDSAMNLVIHEEASSSTSATRKR
jgi:hypothetical protein